MRIKKIIKTIITVIIWLVLIYISKYLQWTNNSEIRQTYRNWEDINGIGGIYGVIISLIIIFIIFPSIWRKTKTEKLIEKGLKKESDVLMESLNLKLITKIEYNKKVEKLLLESKIKSENKNIKNFRQIEKDRFTKSLEKLTELRNNKLISDKEFEEKKSKLFPKRIDLNQLEDLVKNYKFNTKDIPMYEKEILTPRIETLDYEK